MTRFSDQMEFHELGRGTGGAASRRYDRQRSLADHMFEDQGWDPQEYVGFRCEMELPIWRSGLCLVMEPR